MSLISGIAVFLVGVALIVVGRPRVGGGHMLPFMRVWAFGQLYVLAALIAVVIGGSLVISNWPI